MTIHNFTRCPCGICTPRTAYPSGEAVVIPGLEILNAARAPSTGPAILVSVQEFPVRNILPIVAALTRIRADFKVLASATWDRAPRLGDGCIFLDVLKGRSANRAWHPALRQAIAFLRSKGLLVVVLDEEFSEGTEFEVLSARLRWDSALVRLITRTRSLAFPVAVDQDEDGVSVVEIGSPAAAAYLAHMATRRLAVEHPAARVRPPRPEPVPTHRLASILFT